MYSVFTNSKMNFRLLFTVLFILPGIIRASRNCCDEEINVNFTKNSICENGNPVAIKCVDGYLMTFSNNWSLYSHYRIEKDEQGEFLYATGAGFKSRAPHFCEGTYQLDADGNNESSRNVFALVCSAPRIWDDRLHNDSSYDTHETSYKNIWFLMLFIYMILVKVTNFLSFITLAITAFLYFYLPEVDNTEGKCTFHLSFCMGIVHACWFYLLITEQQSVLPNLCITNLYLQLFFMLASFCWTGVISFDMWNRSRDNRRLDESTLMCRYYSFGYGLPSLLVLLSNIVAHSKRLYAEFRLELSCYEHQSTMIVFFTVFPTVAILLANLFFFVDIQRRLWNVQPLNIRNNIPSKIIKYRFSLYGKLFVIMGIPWIFLFISFILFLVYLFENVSVWFWYSFCFFLLIVSSEGIFIFLILVVNRSRMCKAIVRRWPASKILIMKIKANNDPEVSTEELRCDANGTFEIIEINNKTIPAVDG